MNLGVSVTAGHEMTAHHTEEIRQQGIRPALVGWGSANLKDARSAYFDRIAKTEEWRVVTPKVKSGPSRKGRRAASDELKSEAIQPVPN